MTKDEFRQQVVDYLRTVARMYGDSGEDGDRVAHVLEVCAHDVEHEHFAGEGIACTVCANEKPKK